MILLWAKRFFVDFVRIECFQRNARFSGIRLILFVIFTKWWLHYCKWCYSNVDIFISEYNQYITAMFTVNIFESCFHDNILIIFYSYRPLFVFSVSMLRIEVS